MRCPACKQRLITGPLRRYETLSEHVFDPNEPPPPLRPTFECPGTCHPPGTFWDPEGAAYGGVGITPSALDSLWHAIDRAQARDRWARRHHLGWPYRNLCHFANTLRSLWSDHRLPRGWRLFI